MLLSARSRTRVKQPEQLSRPDCHEIRRAWHIQSRCLALERNPAKSMLGPSCATRAPNQCRDPQARSQTSHILPLCFGSHNTVQEFLWILTAKFLLDCTNACQRWVTVSVRTIQRSQHWTRTSDSSLPLIYVQIYGCQIANGKYTLPSLFLSQCVPTFTVSSSHPALRG